MPYYQIEPGEYRFNHHEHGDVEAQAMTEFEIEQCRRQGMEAVPFLPKRGEVLLWHHSLLHGGSPGDLTITRKSFVVHYTTMGRYESTSQSLLVEGEGGDHHLQAFETFKVLGRNRCYGFDSPVLVLRTDAAAGVSS